MVTYIHHHISNLTNTNMFRDILKKLPDWLSDAWLHTYTFKWLNDKQKIPAKAQEASKAEEKHNHTLWKLQKFQHQ